MCWCARALFDADAPCSAEPHMAKYLAAKAGLQCHGGYGFAAEYDVERKFREARLHPVAPLSSNLVLRHVAEHLLGLPRSF